MQVVGSACGSASKVCKWLVVHGAGMHKLNSKKTVAHDVTCTFVKGDEIFLTCDRHSFETMAASKYITEFEQLQKLIVDFISKFQDRGIKIS